ncbi:hypothetical protein [uncultured Clostridium sp.]|uniref:hypothetical protein n=1 Tax=uncultured Clostridium sp. TaxID=59620 RepID=UPI00261B9862|nr:hypothetical protein [uncultured Clostridium sp.]
MDKSENKLLNHLLEIVEKNKISFSRLFTLMGFKHKGPKIIYSVLKNDTTKISKASNNFIKIKFNVRSEIYTMSYYINKDVPPTISLDGPSKWCKGAKLHSKFKITLELDENNALILDRQAKKTYWRDDTSEINMDMRRELVTLSKNYSLSKFAYRLFIYIGFIFLLDHHMEPFIILLVIGLIIYPLAGILKKKFDKALEKARMK